MKSLAEDYFKSCYTSNTSNIVQTLQEALTFTSSKGEVIKQ